MMKVGSQLFNIEGRYTREKALMIFCYVDAGTENVTPFWLRHSTSLTR